MLVHAIVAALPLVLAAQGKGDTASSGTATSQEKSDPSARKRDSLPGASGALGQGEDGQRTGAKGRKNPRAAGESDDTTSGAKSGRWDRAGGRSASEGGTGAGSMDPTGASTGAKHAKKGAGQAKAKGKAKPAAKAQGEKAAKGEKGAHGDHGMHEGAKGGEKGAEQKPAETK